MEVEWAMAVVMLMNEDFGPCTV